MSCTAGRKQRSVYKRLTAVSFLQHPAMQWKACTGRVGPFTAWHEFRQKNKELFAPIEDRWGTREKERDLKNKHLWNGVL